MGGGGGGGAAGGELASRLCPSFFFFLKGGGRVNKQLSGAIRSFRGLEDWSGCRKRAGGAVREDDGAAGWGGGAVRIARVKLLFPPGEKKGANDTLELGRSSLSFMGGERHTHGPLSEVSGERGSRVGRDGAGGGVDSRCHPTAPARTKRKEGDEPLR